MKDLREWEQQYGCQGPVTNWQVINQQKGVHKMEKVELNNDTVEQALNDASAQSEDLLKMGGDAEELINSALEKAEKHQDRIRDFWKELHDLLRLAGAWWQGHYTDIPWQTISAVLGAIIYFINPLDLIPDMIPGVGYVDDAAVVGFVIVSIQQELEIFRNWESCQEESV
jgi:uncharacterized membrane protein YkvA (DUF1232 family)